MPVERVAVVEERGESMHNGPDAAQGLSMVVYIAMDMTCNSNLAAISC